jgi:hypothetical protein
MGIKQMQQLSQVTNELSLNMYNERDLHALLERMEVGGEMQPALLFGSGALWEMKWDNTQMYRDAPSKI